jgi:hypothetical protein
VFPDHISRKPLKQPTIRSLHSVLLGKDEWSKLIKASERFFTIDMMVVIVVDSGAAKVTPIIIVRLASVANAIIVCICLLWLGFIWAIIARVAYSFKVYIVLQCITFQGAIITLISKVIAVFFSFLEATIPGHNSADSHISAMSSPAKSF